MGLIYPPVIFVVFRIAELLKGSIMHATHTHTQLHCAWRRSEMDVEEQKIMKFYFLCLEVSLSCCGTSTVLLEMGGQVWVDSV